MARVSRKRKSASTADDALPASSSTSQASPGEGTRQSARISKKGKTEEAVAANVEALQSAAIPKTPKNPQATFEGLPAELRLQIYEYLCDSSLIHVHRHTSKEPPHTSRFTWTPCRLANPKTPLLCANPKWSGMCKEEDRCTYRIYAPPEPRGFWAVAASNKAIRNEAQKYFLRETVVSLHWDDLLPWLDYLAEHAPQQIDHLRRVTLVGQNEWSNNRSGHVKLLRERVPKLEGLGLQCHGRDYVCTMRDSINFDVNRWKYWLFTELTSQSGSPITFSLESIIWHKPRTSRDGPDRHIAIRMLSRDKRKDKGVSEVAGDEGDDDDDGDDGDGSSCYIDVEIDDPGKLAVRKRNAKWRYWWKVVVPFN